jgi:predicted transcriptional regulator
MASKKVTITLDENLVEALSGAAEAEGIPLSRLVAGAAERELRLRAGRAVIEQWQAEHGAFTPEELAAARAELATADSEYLSAVRASAA